MSRASLLGWSLSLFVVLNTIAILLMFFTDGEVALEGYFFFVLGNGGLSITYLLYVAPTRK